MMIGIFIGAFSTNSRFEFEFFKQFLRVETLGFVWPLIVHGIAFVILEKTFSSSIANRPVPSVGQGQLR